MTCTVSDALGTVKSRMPVTVNSGALSSSQGLALPCAVRVRSMIYPIMTLVMASMILEIMGKDHQERSAPNRCQLEHVCIVYVQIGSQHRVEQQRAGRAEKIPQPLFRRCHIF